MLTTNCGELTPKFFDIKNPAIKPSPTGGHIPYFHQLLCQWAFSMALSFFWVVVIEPQNFTNLKESILALKNIDPSKDGQWDITDREINKVFSEQTQKTIGCIFADSVSMPGETITTEHFGGASGRMGHLKSPGIVGRSSDGNLEIGFRETNLSFTDYFLRPWSIITGYKGLIADNGSLNARGSQAYWKGSIKANITIYQLAKAYKVGTYQEPNLESVVRKHIDFYDCCPINVSSDAITSESKGVNMRQVNFAYNYSVVRKGLGY